MGNNRKALITVLTMGLLLLGLTAWCLLKSPDSFSQSERRALAQPPEFTLPALMSGRLTEDFEAYALDQFPARDGFRGIKAGVEYGVFRRMDNNGIYLAEGHLSKLNYPLSESMTGHALERFDYLYQTYMQDRAANIYFSIVPDKNAYMAAQNGYPDVNVEEMADIFRAGMPYAEYIPIHHLLQLEDYYTTDSHWRQERIADVAGALVEAMGGELSAEYRVQELDDPFYGVYWGQSALPLAPDSISYVMSGALEGCTLTSYDTGAPVEKPVYDLEKARGRDPYEMFLSGSDALQVLSNPAGNGRELVLIRDSFASSLAPLMIDAYSSITLVDIRYIQSALIGNFIDFEGKDVLFIYSTSMLNNSLGLR